MMEEKSLGFEIVKRHGILIALSLVMSLFLVDIFFVSVSSSKIESQNFSKIEKNCKSKGDEMLKEIPKLSQIKNPSITKNAASSACSVRNINNCKDIGSKAWFLVLFSFVILLIFNLAYGFFKNRHIQWKWEIIMTGIFILFWFVFDKCAQNLWYPIYIVKLAITIYVVYLYFFVRRKENLQV